MSILAVLVMLLVPALAWMQYRWLGQLSEAEGERMQRTLKTAAAQFATEFDTELSRLLISLQIDGVTVRDENWRAYAERYSRWTSTAAEPRIVRDVLLIDTLPGTPLPAVGFDNPIPAGRLRLRKWNTQALAFESIDWPPDLELMRNSFAQRFIGFSVQRNRPGEPNLHREASFSLTVGDGTTLVAPVTLFELQDATGPSPKMPKITILGFTIIRLEPAVIRDTMLASLAARHFRDTDTEVNYRVAVVERNDPKKVVWESEPGIAQAVASAPDVTQAFMGPRPDPMFIFSRGLRGESITFGTPPPSAYAREQSGELRRDRAGAASGREGGPGNDGGPAHVARDETKVVVAIEGNGRAGNIDGRIITRAAPLGGTEGRWLLMAKHRSGSLEAAVAQARSRNLMISSSVLILLTLAVGLIVVSARRAQALARQQMEFVAAVSHELRTPVSVIGAAAGNLADGVVGDPQRVRKYGETIQGEARRLAETVERVLQLAGIAAGRAAAARLPVAPAELIHESLAACRLEIEAAGFTVETAIADDLPNVGGDVTALRSALQNLISNAVKYGGDARWLRVSAKRPDPGTRLTPDGVIFMVEDRGLGIDAEDRKHIFEPFYRGREAVSQQIQGSGLGLNLVQRIADAHGGRITVSSEPGKGSTFTLSLPAVHDRPSTRYAEADLQTRPTT